MAGHRQRRKDSTGLANDVRARSLLTVGPFIPISSNLTALESRQLPPCRQRDSLRPNDGVRQRR